MNNTCQHGSTCKDLIDDYMCLCAPGYRGDRCEIDIDECELNACKNGANCTDKVADYDCTCSTTKNAQGQLFSGKNCTYELTICKPENNPKCENNATCHPFLVNEATREENYTCECRPGFTGKYCQTPTTASFNGISSSIQKKLNQTSNNYISFRFRTTLPSVILFVWKGTYSSRMFVHLEIINGRLQMGYIQGTGPNDAILSFARIPVHVNDSNWHEIILEQKSNQLNLTLNSVLCKNNRAACTKVNNFLLSSPLDQVYFGNPKSGFMQGNTISKSIFKGCMEDIKVNSEIVLPSSTGGNTITINTEVGCPRVEQCFADTCSHHGVCYDFWNTFQCDCERPHIGNRCEDGECLHVIYTDQF